MTRQVPCESTHSGEQSIRMRSTRHFYFAQNPTFLIWVDKCFT